MDKLIISEEKIKNKIYTIRSVQVILDEDLARLYQVETKQLNKAVNRNLKRFPEYFRFQINKEEYETILRFQNGTLKENLNEDMRGKHRKYLPYAFTEQGVSMLSAVLRSDIAIEVSIKIIDTFVNMRRFLLSNASIFQRLDNIEYKLLKYDENFDRVFKAIESKNIKPIQGIFYNGQIFDAYVFVNDLLKSAKKEIVLIDGYIDDTILTLFSKYPNIKFKIITQKISKHLKLDIEKYNKQYQNLEVKVSNKYHDRFLIIDDKELYYIGASLKDLGNKTFAFSKMDINSLEIIKKLEDKK